VEQLQALLQDIDDNGGNACDVSARAVETGNEAKCYGVCAHDENYGNRRSCSLGGADRQIVANAGRSMTSRYIHLSDSVLLAAADAVANRTSLLMGDTPAEAEVIPLRAGVL
jgi:hypothetical protein